VTPAEIWGFRIAVPICLGLAGWTLKQVLALTEAQSAMQEKIEQNEKEIGKVEDRNKERIEDVEERQTKQYADLKSDMKEGFSDLKKSVTKIHDRIDKIKG